MTQTGGLTVLCAWLIYAALLAVLGYLLLRHEQDPLQDLTHPDQDDQDQARTLNETMITSRDGMSARRRIVFGSAKARGHDGVPGSVLYRGDCQ